VHLGWEDGRDKQVRHGEQHVGADGRAGGGDEGAAPVGPFGLDDGHEERADGGDGGGAQDEDVGADALDEPAGEEVGDGAGDDHGEEAERRLYWGEGLDGLEEEGEEEFGGIEDSPDDEDGDAEGREDAIAPERGGDDGLAAEAFLSADVEGEYGDENDSNWE